MSLAPLRDAFPVLAHTAYLNAGSCGPSPAAAAAAMAEETRVATEVGRGLSYYHRLDDLRRRTREAWSRLLGAPVEEIALTIGASDGIARALGLMDWAAGDQVVTTDEEHPGVLGPLGALVRRHGIDVVVAPWDEVAAAVSPTTRLVVTSHVSWLRGRLADTGALAAAGVPVILDAAQSAGAIPVDLTALRGQGVVAYAAAGQKWTCGPVGTGAVWIDPDWAPDGGAGVWPTHDNLQNPSAGLGAIPWADARRLDATTLSCELLSGGLAALELLESAGWDAVTAAGVAGARRLAERLGDAGLEVNDRGATTLVSWRSPDPQAEADRALAAGVLVRNFPAQPWVRASVGAWTTDDDLDRLLAAVTAV